jgi:hypothetical protein
LRKPYSKHRGAVKQYFAPSRGLTLAVQGRYKIIHHEAKRGKNSSHLAAAMPRKAREETNER